MRLFAEDLKYTERSSFLHPDFRDLSSEKLNILGFQHAITYCTQLSQLLPPSQIIRPEFEPVAWTQCALPLKSLSEEVLAVNKSLGVPKASVVVSPLFF